MKLRNVAIFLGFLLFAILLRSVSFFLSVIDTDESLYMLMTNSLLNGDVLYQNIFDHKPPGIYIIFAMFKVLFQNTIFSMRIAACIAVASSAHILYLTSKNVFAGKGVLNLLPGGLYLIFTLNNGGLASNTEIFFTPFVVGAFYILFKVLQTEALVNANRKMVVIGLLLGLGLQVKYIVIFDFIAVLLILVTYYFYFRDFKTNNFKRIFYNIFSLSFLFFLPFLLIMLYFYSIGYFDLYFKSNFLPNIVNSTNTEFSIKTLLLSIYEFFGESLLISLGGIGALTLLFTKNRVVAKENMLVYLFIWLFMTFIGVCYTKRFYDHYFLQTLPPLCLLTGLLCNVIFGFKVSTSKEYICLALIVFPSLFYIGKPYFNLQAKIIKYRYFEGQEKWGDTPGRIALYIKSDLNPEDYIYIANYEPIIYDLASAQIPTKFVFPLFIISDHFSKVANINSSQELRRILEKEPRYIVYNPVEESSVFYNELREHLNTSYNKVNSIEGVSIYKRR